MKILRIILMILTSPFLGIFWIWEKLTGKRIKWQ